jgi:hypothetical protein
MASANGWRRDTAVLHVVLVVFAVGAAEGGFSAVSF